MNIKILIVSILAVALLTLVSFSNVVAYKSVKSDIKIESPLFCVKNSKRALSSDYLGKYDSINLFPVKRNSEEELFVKFMDIISMIDDATFDKFVNGFIAYIHQNDFDFNHGEIEDILLEIKSNPDIINIVYLDKSFDSEYSQYFSYYSESCLFLIIWIFLLIMFSPIMTLFMAFKFYIATIIDYIFDHDILSTL